MNKIFLYLLIGVIGGIGASKAMNYIFPHECPTPCAECPTPTVNVQPFGVDKIKGLREFNFSPQFSGNISVAGVDSAALRKMIHASMLSALNKLIENDKKKRK